MCVIRKKKLSTTDNFSRFSKRKQRKTYNYINRRRDKIKLNKYAKDLKELVCKEKKNKNPISFCRTIPNKIMNDKGKAYVSAELKYSKHFKLKIKFHKHLRFHTNQLVLFIKVMKITEDKNLVIKGVNAKKSQHHLKPSLNNCLTKLVSTQSYVYDIFQWKI